MGGCGDVGNAWAPMTCGENTAGADTARGGIRADWSGC